MITNVSPRHSIWWWQNIFLIYFRTLRKVIDKDPERWDEYLDLILFSLRSKKQMTTKYSPFYLMYNREARWPRDLPDLTEKLVSHPGILFASLWKIYLMWLFVEGSCTIFMVINKLFMVVYMHLPEEHRHNVLFNRYYDIFN